MTKATFQVSQSILEAIRMAVRSGEAPSASAFVEDAVRARLREIRRAQREAEYRRAAANPEFMSEMMEITNAFDSTLLDGLDEE